MNRKYRPLAALVFVPGLLLAGTAYADHNEPDRSVRPERAFDVRVIAHELEDAATVLHRRAEKTAHHPSYSEERALRQLHALEERADQEESATGLVTQSVNSGHPADVVRFCRRAAAGSASTKACSTLNGFGSRTLCSLRSASTSARLVGRSCSRSVRAISLELIPGA